LKKPWFSVRFSLFFSPCKRALPMRCCEQRIFGGLPVQKLFLILWAFVSVLGPELPPSFRCLVFSSREFFTGCFLLHCPNTFVLTRSIRYVQPALRLFPLARTPPFFFFLPLPSKLRKQMSLLWAFSDSLIPSLIEDIKVSIGRPPS